MPAIGNMDELLGVIGPAAFRTLVEVRGGTSLRIPKCPRSAEQIAQWIGTEATLRLIGEFGGFVIEVPNLKATPAYDHRVIPLLEQMTDAEIAITVGCTERTVRKIRARKHRPPGSLPASNFGAAS